MAMLLGWLSACSSDELSAIPEPAATPAGRWQQDVRYVFDNVARLHVDAFHHASEQEFEQATVALLGKAPGLTDQELVLGMARVMASLKDARATVEFGAERFPALPFELASMSDGYYLVAVPADQAEALGGRLVSVGGVTIDEAVTRLGEVISHENEYGLGARAADVLLLPHVLQALGLSDSESSATFEFEAAGSTWSIVLKLGAEAEVAPLARIERAAEPLTARNNERYYWHQFLPQHGVMYWQVNRCDEDPKHSFADYAAQFLAELDRPAVRRLILDLRWNHAGQESVARKVYLAMKRHRLNRPGGILVLVGPGTVGSAQSLALNLRERTAATLLGRPLGQRENTFGEVREFSSPNYGVGIGYPTKFYARGSAEAASVQPDLPMPLTYEDWRRGLDRAFESALKIPLDSGGGGG